MLEEEPPTCFKKEDDLECSCGHVLPIPPSMLTFKTVLKPENIDFSKMKAAFSHGVIEVNLPIRWSRKTFAKCPCKNCGEFVQVPESFADMYFGLGENIVNDFLPEMLKEEVNACLQEVGPVDDVVEDLDCLESDE